MRLAEISHDYLLSEAAWPQSWADDTIRNPRFTRWLQNLGIDGQIGEPREGGVGRAYPVGREHMVKFTVDRKEASAAAILKGHGSKHAADIYDVRLVGTFPDTHNPLTRKPLYAIVMQKVNTGVGKRMRVAGNAVYSYLDNNGKFIKEPHRVVNAVMRQYMPSKYKNDQHIKGLVSNIVNALYDVQEKTGILSQDPHGGNLGFKGRHPAFFDFGRSNTDYDHPKAADARVLAMEAIDPEVYLQLMLPDRYT